MPPGRTVRIGSDHVIVQDDRVVVISRATMEAWEVRGHRQTLIRFEGRDWRIVERTVVPPDATRYVLVAWEADSHRIPGVTVEYGPEYAAARDRSARLVKRTRRASGLLRIASPFTGFLSGRIKDRLEVTYGIDPVASTKQSVIIEAILALGGLVATQIGMAGGGFPWYPFLAVTILLAPDVVVRWDRILGEQRPPPGFYEWTVRFPRS